MTKKKNTIKYSLVHVSDKGIKTEFCFKNSEESQTQVNLTQIDDFTTKFSDEAELLECYKDYFSEGHFYIAYEEDGRTKYTDVCYSDCEDIATIAQNFKGKTHIISEEHTFIVYNLINQIINNQALYTFLEGNHYIKESLARNIRDLRRSLELYDGTVNHPKRDYLKRIMQELKNYDEFRNLILMVKAYHKMQEIIASENKRK